MIVDIEKSKELVKNSLIHYIQKSCITNRFSFYLEISVLDEVVEVLSDFDLMDNILEKYKNVEMQFHKISIDQFSSDDELIAKMSNSTSLIIVNSDGPSANNREKRMIELIHYGKKEIVWINNFLNYINGLPKKQRHVVIANLILDIPISKVRKMKGCAAAYAMRAKGIESLALMMPETIIVHWDEENKIERTEM